MARGQRAIERVEHACERDEDRDHGGDAEQAHQRPSRCVREVAERHPGDAAERKSEPFEQRREPDGRGRERADADRCDGRHADGAEYGVRGGQQRGGETERGRANVDPREERRLPGG